MAKIIGNITWEPQPGYPYLSGEANSERIDARFVAAMDKIAENLPSYGAAFYDDRFSFFNSFSSLRLSSRSVRPLPGNALCEINLIYSSQEVDQDEGDETIEYQSVEVDVPIEQHQNYRARWNYKLLCKHDDPDAPIWEFWDDATDTSLTAEMGAHYKWAKPEESAPDGWFVLEDTEKAGVETFKTFVTEVHYRKYSRSKGQLQRMAANDGTIQAPPDTFGRSGDWLQNGSSIRKEGRFYVLEVSYLNSRVVDNEIYD